MKIFDKKQQINALRRQRDAECFKVINRGKAWYDLLTLDQETELKQWYHDWLNVTETLVIPIAPAWLNEKLSQEEDVL